MVDAFCPSSRCEEGNLLIGRVLDDGSVAMMREPRVVTEAFVAEAAKVGSPERYFRFSSPCASDRCIHWTHGECQVPSLVRSSKTSDRVAIAKPCGIRQKCRWFAQEGIEACVLCPLVRTEV